MNEQEIKLELEKWRGLSAYEVAVKNGFNGTETEWLEALMGGTIQITVCGKAIGTDGDIKVYADDIKMEAGALNTVKTKMDAMTEVTDALGKAFTVTDEGIDLNGKYIDNALFR